MRPIPTALVVLALGCDPAGAASDPQSSAGPTASVGRAPASLAPSVPPGSPAAPALPALSASPAPPVASAPPAPLALRDGCPPEMARVGKSCIDRWEAELVDAATGAVHPHAERPESGVRYAARSAPGVFPQAYINRLEAQAACAAAGKRLCSIREWYPACMGTKRLTYGYGPRYVRDRCNANKPHLLSKMFGNDPHNWSFGEHFNSPKLDLEPGFLARTGEYAECTNDYGVHDMIGNLHEWVSDRVDRSLVAKIPLRDDIRDKIGVNTGHGIFMGGFFSTLSEHGRGCTFLTPGHEPKYHDYSTGFRCCRDAGP